MDDKRCFVQFPHPGGEHSPGRDGHKWSPRQRHGKDNPHRRKFLEFDGEWTDENGRSHPDTLWAWGEWEADSTHVRPFSRPRGDRQLPRHLWRPCWIPRPTYDGLHNTDPFIFGDRFLYSNCGQTARNKQALKHLAPGSVIAFGSGKKLGDTSLWVLDTVLVVRDACWYDPTDPARTLEGTVSEDFLGVTGEPLSAHKELRSNPNGRCLRLYLGATPSDPVFGMYSFFPAMRAGTEAGFARPSIALDDEYFCVANTQMPKGATRHIDCDNVLHRLWQSLVDQVRNPGLDLVIGTQAKLPPRPES